MLEYNQLQNQWAHSSVSERVKVFLRKSALWKRYHLKNRFFKELASEIKKNSENLEFEMKSVK